jgi:hypothetical protein
LMGSLTVSSRAIVMESSDPVMMQRIIVPSGGW